MKNSVQNLKLAIKKDPINGNLSGGTFETVHMVPIPGTVLWGGMKDF